MWKMRKCEKVKMGTPGLPAERGFKIEQSSKTGWKFAVPID
jgi:hypothetical protein